MRFPPMTKDEWNSLNLNNRELVEDFLYNSTELSDATIRSYRSDLGVWLRWIKYYAKNKNHTDIKSREYLRFQNFLVEKERSSSDVRSKRSAISSLNSYIEVYYQDEFPKFRNFINRGVKQPEHTVSEKTPPSLEQMETLMLNLENRKEWQKLAYVSFSFDTGARREEVRSLLKEVVDYKPIVKKISIENEDGKEETRQVKYFETHDIRCKGKGKTGKVRKFQFSERTMRYIKKWVSERGNDDCEFVFVSDYAKKISQISGTTFNNWCNNDFSKILDMPIYPHLFRSARATALVKEEGRDIELARRLLGHESSDTTRIYVVGNNDENVDELFIV